MGLPAAGLRHIYAHHPGFLKSILLPVHVQAVDMKRKVIFSSNLEISLNLQSWTGTPEPFASDLHNALLGAKFKISFELVYSYVHMYICY